MDTAAPSAPPRIDSRASFAAAVRWAFDSAFTAGARRIVCVDADFAAWPLDDAGLLQGLTLWLQRPQRRLVLLAAGYDGVPRRSPRFVAWRAAWSHAVDAWLAPEDSAHDLPTLCFSDGPACLQLIDPVHWRGRAANDERQARAWAERTDAVLQRSERAFAVRSLGL